MLRWVWAAQGGQRRVWEGQGVGSAGCGQRRERGIDYGNTA